MVFSIIFFLSFQNFLSEYTLEELAQYDGKNASKESKVYIAVKNIVFDVSTSGIKQSPLSSFWLKRLFQGAYKPGGSYAVLAGRDCSVALAKSSLDEKYMNVYHSTTLEKSEEEKLEGWFIFMKKKYPIMGRINPPK